ncbi:MAG TPA: HAD hydrolase-like protein [Polyangia bacterium]
MSAGGHAADLVIFDLDGTLADTAPDIAFALNRALEGAGLPSLPIETVIGYVGDGAAKLIERALPAERRERDLAPVFESFLAIYEARPCVDSRLYPGIEGLLQALARAGVATAVLTNKAGSLARTLVQTLLPSHQFQAVVGDRDGYPRKPDPTAARTLVARARTIPARTVVVGDGLPDVRLAHALKARSLAAAWGYSSRASLLAESPTWVLDDPSLAVDILLSGHEAA